MFTAYVLVTILFVSVTIVGVAYIRLEQAKSRYDRAELTNLNRVLHEKTFPALTAASQAVESSQQLIMSIQRALSERPR